MKTLVVSVSVLAAAAFGMSAVAQAGGARNKDRSAEHKCGIERMMRGLMRSHTKESRRMGWLLGHSRRTRSK
ncbi:MAG: hypothetical protein ACR2PG_08000 [Hyphomicrobiaceae bacterium]